MEEMLLRLELVVGQSHRDRYQCVHQSGVSAVGVVSYRKEIQLYPTEAQGSHTIVTPWADLDYSLAAVSHWEEVVHPA